jgi:hypothetical protein
MDDAMLEQVASALNEHVQKQKQLESAPNLVGEKEASAAAAAAGAATTQPEEKEEAKAASAKEKAVAKVEAQGLMLPESVAAWQQRSGKGATPARIAVAK